MSKHEEACANVVLDGVIIDPSPMSEATAVGDSRHGNCIELGKKPDKKGGYMLSADFVASYLEAWNQHDPGGVADHLSQNGTYLDIPEQQQLNRSELVTHLEGYFKRDTNSYLLVGEVLTGQNTIAFQYRACPDGCDEDGGWMGAEFITMDGAGAGLIEDYYRNPAIRSRGRGEAPGRQRYAKSGLSAEAQQAMLNSLIEVMEEDKAFLDSNLSLPDLAERLNCSINHLSQAINDGHGVSFFDFVNRYRVKEATDILVQPDNINPSILDVALEVGFNSTSTFYAAFKKATGKTPAQYRREAVLIQT
ncbi:MAG: helix-turn-helix domain-containing protein [Pseudomonadota bacterium]